MAKPVSVANVAQLLKLTERRVQQLVQDGVLPRPVKRLYEPVACVHSYIDYLKKLASGTAEMSLTDERTRFTKLQADLAEIALRKARGEMISSKKATTLWGEVIGSVRQRLLGLPTRLAPVVAGRSIPQAKERLEVAMHEVLAELTNPDLFMAARSDYDRTMVGDMFAEGEYDQEVVEGEQAGESDASSEG